MLQSWETFPLGSSTHPPPIGSRSLARSPSSFPSLIHPNPHALLSCCGHWWTICSGSSPSDGPDLLRYRLPGLPARLSTAPRRAFFFLFSSYIYLSRVLSTVRSFSDPKIYLRTIPACTTVARKPGIHRFCHTGLNYSTTFTIPIPLVGVSPSDLFTISPKLPLSKDHPLTASPLLLEPQIATYRSPFFSSSPIDLEALSLLLTHSPPESSTGFQYHHLVTTALLPSIHLLSLRSSWTLGPSHSLACPTFESSFSSRDEATFLTN